MDFEIQTDYLISARRPEQAIVNKKKENLPNSGVAVPVDHRIKLKESENGEKYLDFARELKRKTMKHDDDGDTNCNWCTRNYA